MIYDVITYDFDRSENTMTDGDHNSETATSATDAVIGFIKKLASYENGTCGHSNYLSLTEVECIDDELTVAAYRNDETTWEVHIYIDDRDEYFTIAA